MSIYNGLRGAMTIKRNGVGHAKKCGLPLTEVLQLTEHMLQ